MNNRKTVLLVDDEPNNLRALRIDLEETDYTTLTARDGLEAWEILEREGENIAAILLDRMMPRMDGMQFMDQLKTSPMHANIPVIMQTAAAEKEQVAEGIKAGVYYYLTKPYDKGVMLSILYAAIRGYAQYNELRQHLKHFKSKLNLVRQSTFEIRTLDEATHLSTFLAQFFPEPERVILGISELVLNAIEHGNLGITYDEKTRLNTTGTWETELKRREALSENASKKVIIRFDKRDHEIELGIKDEGNGFAWHNYLEISPDRATDNHGRGIAMAKMMSFDEITYLGNGSEVVCKVRL